MKVLLNFLWTDFYLAGTRPSISLALASALFIVILLFSAFSLVADGYHNECCPMDSGQSLGAETSQKSIRMHYIDHTKAQHTYIHNLFRLKVPNINSVLAIYAHSIADWLNQPIYIYFFFKQFYLVIHITVH